MSIFKLLLLSFLIVIFFQGRLYAQENNDQFSNTENKINNTSKFNLALGRNFTSKKYILGPNDVLSIYVYDTPELSQEKIRVQPDGKIILEPLGSLRVAGMTIDDLHDLLVEKYKYYLNDPRVTIKIDQTKPFIVYITGAVINPGSYEIETDTANTNSNLDAKTEIHILRKSPLLSNILVAAGGISYDADLEHIKITNPSENKEIDVNLLDLLEKSDSSQDIYLMSGDVVNIPRLPTPFAVNDEKYKKYMSATFSPKSIPVKVFGYVNNPGLVQLDPAVSLNLNSAITSAGGYLKDSAYAPANVFLSRVDKNGKLVTTVVNPMSNDLVLRPNDIIYVPEKSRPLIGKAFDYMLRIAVPASEYANTYNNWALMFNPKRYAGAVVP